MQPDDNSSKLPLKPNQLTYQASQDLMNSKIKAQTPAGAISAVAGGRSSSQLASSGMRSLQQPRMSDYGTPPTQNFNGAASLQSMHPTPLGMPIKFNNQVYGQEDSNPYQYS